MFECPYQGCVYAPGHNGRHSNEPVVEAPHDDCGIAVTVMGDPEYPKGRMDHCKLPAGHTGDHSADPVKVVDLDNVPDREPELLETDPTQSDDVRPDVASLTPQPETATAEQMVREAPAANFDFENDEEADNPERAFGRPTKFREEYTEQMLKFFRKDPVEKIETVTSGSNGKGGEWSKTEVRYEALTFPTLELFADSIDVSSQTLLYWAGRYPSDFTEVEKRGQLRHPDFSAAYSRIKELQKGHLLQHSLTGKLNSGFAQFFAINNLGMQSKSVVEETVKHTYEDLPDEQLDAAIKARENRTA